MPLAFCRPSRLVFGSSHAFDSYRPLIQSSRHVFHDYGRSHKHGMSLRRYTVQAALDAAHGRKKIGAVIIGNEILNGKTIDKNLSTLALFVESHGAILEQAITIRDDIDIIAGHVKSMSLACDLVFTSGGIGPTLDDVTYAGVAKAFELTLQQHEETIQRMKESRYAMELNTARLRMATLPSECDVYWTPGLWVPLAVVQNVYILPGIPKLFEKMLQSVPAKNFGSRKQRVKQSVLCDMAEGDLAALLESVSDEFKVALGSYPATTEEARKRYKSMITLEGDDAEEVMKAAEIIRQGVNGRYEHEI